MHNVTIQTQAGLFVGFSYIVIKKNLPLKQHFYFTLNLHKCNKSTKEFIFTFGQELLVTGTLPLPLFTPISIMRPPTSFTPSLFI